VVGRTAALAGEDGVIRRLVAASAMLAAAAFLVLLARDVWHWDRAVHDADARAAVAPVAPAAWQTQTTLPAGLTRRLLGINDDLVFRRTMMGAIHAASHFATTESQKQRSIVETALARIARDDPAQARASRAADYLGVLLYTDPPSPDQAANAYVDPTQQGPSNQLTPEQKALLQFLVAVRLDPNNDNAQRNLERMLRQPQPPPHKGIPQSGGGERVGHKGSGARPPGRGY
jgi:hypothetical protein